MTPTAAAATPHPAHALDEQFAHIALDLIDPSKVQPRTIFPADYLEQLKVSVQEKGVLEPILLRPRPKGRFEIVAGECRTRAAKMASLTHIPAVVRSYTDEQVLEIQLEENIHRKNLTPLEEAVAYRRLIATNPDKHSAATIATRIGMSVSYVWDYLKLNDLIPEAKKILAAERMTVGHAILIARLKPEDQERVIDPAGDHRYGRGEGLWRGESGLSWGDWDDKKGADKYEHVEAVSIRELDDWIKTHIRFDVAHAAKAQPLEFEQVAAKVEEATAKPGRGKKVIAITSEYRVADDARDEKERTYGSQSWERADGQEKSKICEYSVLGVVAAGERYGQTLDVCIARDKCRVHFGKVITAKEKAAKQRESGKPKQAAKTEKRAEQSWEIENRKRQEASARWDRLKPHAIAAVAAKIKPGKLTDKVLQAVARQVCDRQVSDKDLETFLGGKVTAKNFIQALGFVDVVSHDNTREYFAPIAKKYGVDLAKLEKEHQSKTVSTVTRCRSRTCTCGHRTGTSTAGPA